MFGHDPPVEEDYALDHTDGSGTGAPSGSGDDEILTIALGENWEYETRYVGAGEMVIAIDKYQTGSGPIPTIEYKTGATRVACEADSWNVYNGTSFTCTGWAKVRMSK